MARFKVKVLAGDFEKKAVIHQGWMSPITFELRPKGVLAGKKQYNFDRDVVSADVVSTRDYHKAVNTKSVFGALALGVPGAILGVLAGGKKEEILLAIVFQDSRKALLLLEKKAYLKIEEQLAAKQFEQNFNPKSIPPSGLAKKSKLVDCPACEHSISINARACPNCGEPLLEADMGFSPSLLGEENKSIGAEADAGSDTLSKELAELVRTEGKIEAIKECRRKTGMGQREAKDFVEKLEIGPSDHGQAPEEVHSQEEEWEATLAPAPKEKKQKKSNLGGCLVVVLFLILMVVFLGE